MGESIKWKKINWNFTKCRAKYKERKSANYTFFIVDYNIPRYFDKYKHIIEMRNKGLVKTKYFHTEKEAKKFLNEVIKFMRY